MNSLGYNEQQARNSKAAYDVMGTCEWLLDREREQGDVLKDFEITTVHQHGSKLNHFPHLLLKKKNECII